MAEGFKRRTLATKFGTAPAEQPHILGQTGLGSFWWQPTTPIRNTRVLGVLDSLEVWRPWLHGHNLNIQKPCPSHGSTAHVPPGKVPEPETGTPTENLQLRGRHSRLGPQSLSLTSGTGARELMSTISI